MNYERRKRTRPEPTTFRDERGRECLRIPLDSHGRNYAKVFAKDYERMQQEGADSVWVLNSNGQGQDYVRMKIRTGRGQAELVQPARIIGKAGPGEIVRYVNGDRTDLRHSNLTIVQGKAGGSDIDKAHMSLGYRSRKRGSVT